MTHIAYRAFDLSDGKHSFAYGEVRYTFTVAPGRAARTWANSVSGYPHPAEAPTVEITQIEWQWNSKGNWIVADSQFGDFLAEVPDEWFLEQIAENAE